MSITVGRQYLEYASAKLQDGDIERTTTKVEYGNLHVLVGLVNTIGQSGGCRLVDDTLDVEACYLACLFGGLTLRVGEIGRHGDDGIGNLLSQIILGGLLHLLQYHGRDFLRCIFTTVDVYTGIATLVDNRIRYARNFLFSLLPVLTHETLDGVHRVLWVGDGLTLGGVTNLTLAVVHKAYYRRCSTLTFAVCDYYRLVALEYGNAAVCSS